MQTITIAELIAARIAAKRAEDAAVAERRRIDGAIAEMLKDANKPEGSVSQKADGYKVTVTYKIDRKVDTDKLQAAWAKLSAAAAQAFKWKADVSVSELRKLEGADAAAASVFITSKPASPSITIEAI
jgi:hypothetical protein